MSRRVHLLDSLEHLVTHAVLAGNISAARHWATHYAVVRDDGLTVAETFAKGKETNR